MNDAQYRQMLANSRRRAAVPLGATGLVDRVVDRAARLARRREAAEAAWLRLVPPELRGRARVVGMKGRTLLVAAPDAVHRHRLQQHAERIARQMAGAGAGFAEIRFLFDADGDTDLQQ